MDTTLDWLKHLESDAPPDVLLRLKGAAAFIAADGNPARCRELFRRLAPDYQCSHTERIHESCEEWFQRLWSRGSLGGGRDGTSAVAA